MSGHTEWNVLRRRSDGEIVICRRGPHDGGPAPDVPPRFDGKPLGRGLDVAPTDIWHADGSLQLAFEVVRIESELKPYSGLDLIGADGAVTKKSPAEVLALEAEVKAMAAEAAVDADAGRDLLMREAWESWKYREDRDDVPYRDWLRAKLRGADVPS